MAHRRHNSSGLGNVFSVKDICNNKENFIKSLKMDDSTYVIPTFSWKKTKFSEVKSKKLDYINLFPEKVHVPQEKLVKIYAKRKHDVPGPEVYDMMTNWSKKGGMGYDGNKGKQYH